MSTKETLRSKTARIREEISQTGHLVLRAPTLIRAVECVIRFLLGAVLAGAEIFGGYAPFGVALVGASGSGTGGFFTLLGVCLGYISFLGFTGALRYAAASVLAFSVAFSFYDIRLYKKVWFMPVVTALLSGATGFVYLSDRGWMPADVVFFATELLFTGAGVYFYRIAFSPWIEPGEEDTLSLRQTVSLLILGGTVLIAMAQINLFQDVSLGRTAACLAVMIVAYKGKLGLGAAMGVTAGLAMDLAAGGGPYYSMSYGLSGLMAGMLWQESRLFAALGYVLTNAVAVLWTWDSGMRLSGLYEVFIASVIFLVLPESALRSVGVMLRKEGRAEGAERAGQYMKERLEATAGAFRELYESLRDAFRPGCENLNDISSVFDRAAGRVCRRCALRDNCWQRDYNTTFNALNDAAPAMLERGRGLPADFPAHFTTRCMHFPEFLAAANEELSGFLCRRQYQSRLGESRQAVCRQYAELGQILNRAAAVLGTRLPTDPAKEKRVRNHLSALGLDGPAAVYYDEAGHLRMELEENPLLKTAEETEELSRLLGARLREPEPREGVLVYTQAEPLMAVAGVAARRRDGETVSGDAGAWFHRVDGTLYILLCDGMGSGPEANRDSSLTVRLLERFLQTGMDPEPALRILNSALALRGEATGGFSTIDLLEVDLFSGEGALYKFGAAPTYVRHRELVSRYSGSALPAGLTAGDTVRPDIIKLHLDQDDCVVLLSDGVTAGTEDGWLREALSRFDGASPKDLARALIDLSNEKSKPADDRTVMVVQIKARAGAEERNVKAAGNV